MDVVACVPRHVWPHWLEEGGTPEAPDPSTVYGFGVPSAPKLLRAGDRLYIACAGRIRGYAPVLWIQSRIDSRAVDLIRDGKSAVAVTIAERVPPFRGFRYRWWTRDQERPFPEWRQAPA